MAANREPIYIKQGHLGFATLTAASPNRDGTGAVSIFTAPADGALVKRIRCRSRGTNVQTVLRVFYNNGGPTNVAANNTLIEERTLPPITTSETVAVQPVDINLDMPIPATGQILVALGTAVAGGWQVSAEGGDF